tara:strand:+ start:107 stop:502 length:396 start_codon:yes stop_codon:yes gene_type:complete
MLNKSITKKQLREFGLILVFFIPIIFGWLVPFLFGHKFRTWTIWIGSISFLITIFNPFFLFYPYKLWMAIGDLLAWINSRLILGLVFLFVLQPIALIMKFSGYDPLRIKKVNKKSYRENKKDVRIDLTRIF